jgi:preprotein translocase subunit SecA
MVWNILEKIVGSANDRRVKNMRPVVARIGELESALTGLSDDQLRAKTAAFRQRIEKGESLDSILPEAFAVVREGGRRALGMRHFDVQLIGGMVLHSGSIAEMRTGEGKTLVATLPAYLNALSGKGVHVVTVNEYLARRDAEWMSRLYNFLDLSCGVVVHGLSNAERRKAYRSDITYAFNSELGFDYLRDNMKFSLDDYVQKELNFAIVDEVDSILIDEARTPLIISGQADDSSELYAQVSALMKHLTPPTSYDEEHKDTGDFWGDEKSRNILLNESGVEKLEKLLGVPNLYDPQYLEVLNHVHNALKAHFMYRRDVDYVVRGGEVLIVDEFTGRVMPGRRWSDGLHQAIEAKEGVTIEAENQTLATITYQNFFRMYGKLGGMTGTAFTEAEEFKKIYNLDVVVIPTNRPVQRNDQHDTIYKTEKEKFEAVFEECVQLHEKGQPVLVGTVSVEKSEKLSAMLRERGTPHEVLNAKQNQREAMIVAQAGRKGAITIATNMAGRGTDILLGGNPEIMAKDAAELEIGELQSKLVAEHLLKVQAEEIPADTPSPRVDDETREAIHAKHLKRFKALCEAEKKEVMAAGGLHILGTERHESRRIDNQLRGRAGRQGDPGSSHFYLSLDDDLMRIFGGERLKNIMNKMGLPDGEPIEHGMVTKSVERAQKQVEAHNFDIRKNVIEYDDVMNEQRKSVYALRRKLLGEGDTRELALDLFDDLSRAIVGDACPAAAKPETWDIGQVEDRVREVFNFSLFLRGVWEAPRLELKNRYFEQAGRSRILAKRAALEKDRGHVEGYVKDLLDQFCPGGDDHASWDIVGLVEATRDRFGFIPQLEMDASGKLKRDAVRKAVAAGFHTIYANLDKVGLTRAEVDALKAEYEPIFDAVLKAHSSPLTQPWPLAELHAALDKTYPGTEQLTPNWDLARYAIEQQLIIGAYVRGRKKGATVSNDDKKGWRELLLAHCAVGTEPTAWTLPGLEAAAREKLGDGDFALTRAVWDRARLEEWVYYAIELAYSEKETALGAPALRHAERLIYLQTIDGQWKQHLQAMDHLRQGIGLRGYGQKDPKFEYKKEGFELFKSMLLKIKTDVAKALLRVEVRGNTEAELEAAEQREREARQRLADQQAAQQAELQRRAEADETANASKGAGKPATGQAARPQTRQTLVGSTPQAPAPGVEGGSRPAPVLFDEPKVKTVRHDGPKIQPNDPCWCASGKKYKKCHGQPGKEVPPPEGWQPPKAA